MTAATPAVTFGHFGGDAIGFRIMKALVLAGGSGTRLRPITHTSAKQLVPVANKPVLFYGLEAIRDAGIVDVGIIVGETAAEIEAAVGDGAAFGIRVTYIHQDAPLGLAHAVLIARDFLADEPFVMYLGDNLIIGGIASLVSEFRRNTPDALILLTKVDNPSAFGVAELGAEGRIVRLVEKPLVPPSDLALVGVYMFGTAVHEAVRAIKPSARGELEITEAIQWLVDGGYEVASHLVEGYWKDTGRLADMLETNRHLLESIEPAIHGTVDADSSIVGRVVIEDGASLVRSTVRGPAIIGRGTTLVDTYVGPFTSIFHSCTIERTEIEYSIVLERATIRGIGRIEDSLIGRDVEVVPSAALPKAHRLMLGDHSRVSVATTGT
ncbi:Glucose-1-phosphate thymidylyltransferase (dTDP-glucose synthase) (dTDP-glucose pyrophosphorylase) (Sugar-nucleotidylation enzyme) [Frankia alni ACN14a]|uniref:Glucose-1-phosphate thymidylyltransferase (dTDP-glucose synthase) (dTDP-glucose pyrophosphorylase) (Sugar-nucleotidylation enzyme) n=2 Tax=Frankiaceae TaxID=74712 RepID=Q0RRD1_FRAAA|nr:Glucose-1-phosphate thymidylyltransferase (dTDP-glucose synthase) (dTDP-glucose pyrophosphorylase) (Sugar-nucleotidylation enzyme) [Frankia alni ACN14a]